MSKVIMVPVHLDGFFLEQEQLAVEAFADFSELPFSGADEDYNPDTANISESILSPPFQNTNLNLKRGMHLHWSLPDALTKGGTGGTADDYPAVPNRWLIKRSSTTLGNAQWVVESDYMTSDLTNPNDSIAYPVDAVNPSDQPFVYLGRRLEATGWTEVSATRLPRLTAMGYGEPAFAAFYPNCHSVFGCFDPNVDTEADLQGLSYQLIGWYSDTTQDPLLELLNANSGASQATLEEAIQDQFAWNVTIDPLNLPAGMVCYAELTFDVAANATLDNSQKSQSTTVSIGNTGTEALSAYLAGQLYDNILQSDPSTGLTSIHFEEQLENLLLQTQLQSGDLDLGARFKEARHAKGFKAVKGGSLWEIKPANENNTATSVAIGLPAGMSDALDELNSLQQQADQAEEMLIRQRHILFADWYKYMLCAYPPDDSRDDYPDIDYVKWYIQNQSIPQVTTAKNDLEEKQETLPLTQVPLKAQVAKFNHSMIHSTALSKQLDHDQADTSGLSLTNTTWEDNSPLSTQCLSLNGIDAEISITGINGIKAISFWVNLDAQNSANANDTVLLANQNGILISRDEITNFRDTIAINGEMYFPSDTEPLEWDDIPKDQWCYLSVVFNTPLQDTDTLWLFSNNGSLFSKGKLMTVDVFTDKTLIFKELTADTADTSGITLTNTAWQDNTPFSTQCLYLNGSDAELSISGIDNIKALSLWVNLATQNADDATLLATAGDGALISKDATAGFWEKICINGLTQPYYQAFQWNSLPKDQWFHLYIEFTDALSNSETLYLFSNNNTRFLNGKLAAIRLFNDTLSGDELYYDQNTLGHEQYELKEVAGPRFWEPAEPVVLIEGNAVEPTLRHGQDGRLNEDDTLDCPDTDVTNYPLLEADFSGLLSDITNGAPTGNEEKIGYDSWSEQPWHPFLLEWEVELFPMELGGNLDVDNRDFDTSFITANYTLEENSPELSVQSSKSVVNAATIYSGRSVLTPYAKKNLTKTMVSHLNNLQQEDCYQVIGTITDAQKDTYTTNLSSWYTTNSIPTIADWYDTDAEYTTAITAYKTWYESKPVYNNGSETTFNTLSDTEKLQDFNYALIETYEEALNSHFISQALSGFNNALLMQHQTLQLPVSDPLGFDDYRTFTDQVATDIGDNTNVAPLPLNDFLPIRSGTLRLLNLRIIDSFGQLVTLDPASPVKAETVALPTVGNTQPTDIWLPPRFTQPVRINFRWLSADSGSQELNSHPESNPVCGWLLANHLDNSVAVYDPRGNALGIINQEARWRNVPGSQTNVAPLDFDNAYLRKVVERLALIDDETDPGDVKKTFLQDFISVTDKALENIAPESAVHHQELALLMGRPIAVVRASLNLELQGDPAIHYGWTEFYQDLERTTRETNGFENVPLPIRLGERGQLNDGVLGYWKENAGSTLETEFHTTVDLTSVTISSSTIEGYQASQPDITQSLGSDPQLLTLLIDPHGDVHATTGMLPAKSINLPKEDYTDALKKINITFLSAPVLSAVDQIALPLPNELGYEWAWLAKDRYSWTETANTGILRKDTLLNTFTDGEALWTELLDKGWILERDTNKADIVPKDQRTSATLSNPFEAQTDAIEAFLDSGHIIPVNTKAVFIPNQTIKEGWLKLSPSDN